MSYILDAIRKSEQQRQRDSAPLMFTSHISSDVGKKPAILLYGLGAFILICAGILIGWWHPWQQVQTEAVKDPIPIAQNQAKLPEIASIPQSFLPDPEKANPPEVIVATQKSISIVTPAFKVDSLKKNVPVQVEAESRKSKTVTALPKVSELLVEEALKPAMKKAIPPALETNNANVTNTKTENAQEQKIIAFTELPLAIQQEIPMMTISGYAYSSVPNERSVGINDRLLQEGEYLVPGLRLEQINTDGLVFSYKKYLFRHSL